MASYYVDSNAGGAGTGADWANAYTTLGAAVAARLAGDVFFVAHNHAETAAAAKTITCPGTPASPNLIYCVTSAGSVPPVAADLRTTATISTTGNNAITVNGTFYMYGIEFNVGSGASAQNFTCAQSTNGSPVFDTCIIDGSAGTGGVNLVAGVSTSSCAPEFRNCTITFAATGNLVQIWQPILFKNCTFNGAAVPTSLFGGGGSNNVKLFVLVDGCDLSAFGAGKTLASGAAADHPWNMQFRNCKLGASVSVSATIGTPGRVVDVINCDSGDTNYRTEKYTYEGTLTTETTIVRTGGASDGTTPIAWKIITTANSEIPRPFVSPPIAIWNETVGSAITATVKGVWGGAAVPDNDEIWIEAQYLGTSGFPMSSKVTNGVATPLHTPVAQDAASDTWGGGTTDFGMSVTFTPQEKGWVYVTVHAALPSTTFYVDPLVTLS